MYIEAEENHYSMSFLSVEIIITIFKGIKTRNTFRENRYLEK
ncbi:hypothetical protein CBF_0558 [Clostridium botulinum F str. 230613]|uniref:Uncharacterized protein n=1 Tax=Clostridium botulinum (strain Langeland / NCTC 10281 / Type F) TaxID=441772 RepID=A7GAR5_CLOBL|nr:hypothetical protein CLI_0590 [Clostridium botulinum F str. Langeland]ADF98335.1 hypothetical protein CBF_0558 [Clostridium botulinum F str. 230613]